MSSSVAASSIREMPVQNSWNPDITIEKGIVSSGAYTMTREGRTFKVQVFKQESEQLKFKISLCYHGIIDNQVSWLYCINDKPVMTGINRSFYVGSNKFVFKPVDADANTLEIQETDEKETGSLWVDLTGTRAYQIYKTPPLSSEKIETLINAGGFFKTADDRKAEAILYNRYAGVFLRIGKEIYHAKDTLKFIQCSATEISHLADDFVMVDSSRNNEETVQNELSIEGSAWEIKFPREKQSHVLRLSEDTAETGEEFIKEASWDEAPLKIITLERGP